MSSPTITPGAPAVSIVMGRGSVQVEVTPRNAACIAACIRETPGDVMPNAAAWPLLADYLPPGMVESMQEYQQQTVGRPTIRLTEGTP